MQGLEVTVGKEQWTIKSGNRVLATRTQVRVIRPSQWSVLKVMRKEDVGLLVSLPSQLCTDYSMVV